MLKISNYNEFLKMKNKYPKKFPILQLNKYVRFKINSLCLN